jgi:hypothetical protein
MTRFSSSPIFFLFTIIAVTDHANASAVHVAPQTKPKNLRQSTLGRTVPRGGNMDVGSKLFRRMHETDQMPSLFSNSELEYDKYSACLAATEGLRRIRDRSLAAEVQAAGGTGTDMKEAEKHINAQYVQNSGRVLRALGMTVAEFNALGRQISQDEHLKEKVMEQAYLYRMAATINMDRANLIEDPASAELLQAFRKDKLHLFCESMSEIEQLRSDQIERLKRSLHVDKFPANVNISDPGLLPFLSPKVRAVVEAFPLQAEDIVKKHGLQSDEFNQMLQATHSNPIFRWKIQKEIRKGKEPAEAS